MALANKRSTATVPFIAHLIERPQMAASGSGRQAGTTAPSRTEEQGRWEHEADVPRRSRQCITESDCCKKSASDGAKARIFLVWFVVDVPHGGACIPVSQSNPIASPLKLRDRPHEIGGSGRPGPSPEAIREIQTMPAFSARPASATMTFSARAHLVGASGWSGCTTEVWRKGASPRSRGRIARSTV